MSQPTGIYGWIRSNDGRSSALFVVFVLAIQPIAALALFMPLALIDADHTPFFNWVGYMARYGLPVLIASIAWFAAEMAWHVATVKKAVGFRFIDNDDEPRLCRVIEPLIIAMGLPTPFVGVIDTSARNAFACGAGRSKAVVVVTRGLIDALDDDELAAVLAHELSHIKNGDIRLMAAANIFVRGLTWLHRKNPLRLTIGHMILAIAVPILLPLTLAGNLLGHLALRAGQLSRLLISSAREYIADAEATDLTKNPAALASALVKIEHDFRVPSVRDEDDAMMIAGETEGKDANHPTVALRIATLARITGSMVFNAPSAPVWTRKGMPSSLAEIEAVALLRRMPAPRNMARLSAGSDENGFGLTRLGTVSACSALLILTAIHARDIDSPQAAIALFDIRPLSLLLGDAVLCTYFPRGEPCRTVMTSRDAFRDFEGQRYTLAGWLADLSKRRRDAGVINADLRLSNFAGAMTREAYVGQSGRRLDATADKVDGLYSLKGGGAFSSAPPEALKAAEVEQVGCFPAKMFHGDPKGYYRLDETVSDGVSMARYLAWARQAESLSEAPGTADFDRRLRQYASQREALIRAAYDLFGRAGLDRLQAAYAGHAHARIIERLKERIADPAFLEGLTLLEAAKIRALANAPDRFVPCSAIR